MSLPGLAREELARIATGRDSAVTIGKFDGVHRGHKHLVSSLCRTAKEAGLASIVVTLHPNPLTVLRPGVPITYLCTLEERLELLRAEGPDSVGILSFTSELSQLSAQDFLTLLIEGLQMRALYIGPDMALGRGREGDQTRLRELAGEMGFNLEVAPLLSEDGGKVGSSAIRQALAAGEMERVAEQLGRPYSLGGPVVTGEARGRTIGFPTANIAVAPDLALPAFGVYITRAHLDGADYVSCTNIGIRPTFESAEARPTIETYIMDFEGDIYGRHLRIELLHRLRDELKFESLPGLIAAIDDDVEQTRRYFALHA